MTNDIAALVERLEKTAADMKGNWDGELDYYSDAVFDAAATITALQARVEELEAGLIRLRDCDWVVTPLDRMDAVRDIARGTLGDAA